MRAKTALIMKNQDLLKYQTTGPQTTTKISYLNTNYGNSRLESVQDFLIKYTMYASSWSPSQIFFIVIFFLKDRTNFQCRKITLKVHFFTKSCHRQTYQNYEQPPRTYQNLYFQSHFSVLKIGRIFPKKKFYEEYLTRRPTFIKKCF